VMSIILTNYMELNNSWEATRHLATRQFYVL
jgi:hypothetical protein